MQLISESVFLNLQIWSFLQRWGQGVVSTYIHSTRLRYSFYAIKRTHTATIRHTVRGAYSTKKFRPKTWNIKKPYVILSKGRKRRYSLFQIIKQIWILQESMCTRSFIWYHRFHIRVEEGKFLISLSHFV